MCALADVSEAIDLDALPIELTILMPCLNEAETLGTCIEKARGFLSASGVAGEVLVADNGSTDGSQDIARGMGARVVDVPRRGYGAALRAGIEAAHGRYTIMGDADDSYDFSRLAPFLDELRGGAKLVMGNRFAGGIAPGAMPPLHRYLGNPVLSFLGNMLFPSPVGDFHCGLRGFETATMRDLGLQTTGMEFASEMVVKSSLANLRIAEVPTTLTPDGRSRPPHLRSWRDGWRHLRFLLIYSPSWLFLYPGLALMVLGLVVMALLATGDRTIGGVTFGPHTLLYSALGVIVGFEEVQFARFTKYLGALSGELPPDPVFAWFDSVVTLEVGLALGIILVAIGFAGTLAALAHWSSFRFGNLPPQGVMHVTIPAVTAIITGVQLVTSSFFMYALRHGPGRHE